MEQANNSKWHEAGVKKHLDQLGNVPPPWVVFPNSHPISLRWRMGAGEEFMTIFFTWYTNQFKTVDERVRYFQKYPPPPRWLAWLVGAIWDFPPQSDYHSYFEKLNTLGFTGTTDYEQDFNNDKWFRMEKEEFKNNQLKKKSWWQFWR